MPTLTIEGKKITVPAGTTIMQAADRLGINIPRFCYHPLLTIVGNCRMCLVEIEGQSKLAASCSMPAAEGMVVKVDSPKAAAGRAGTIEFLLANHPLDCPICDKSGECVLQDNSMDHGVMKSRFRFAKVRKPKAVDIGRHIVLDAERCIMCTRCTRFLDEVSGTHELGIFGRGNTEEIGLVPGIRLDSAYSGCVADLCPVGALTLKEFRFRSRTWFLRGTATVCPSCARGCNITLEANLNPGNKMGPRRVYRLLPRANVRVNREWMCDEGRFRFSFVDSGRVREPVLREGGVPRVAAWDEALGALFAALRRSAPTRTGFLLSRSSTVEDLFMARALLKRMGKGAAVAADVPAGRPATSDKLLRLADKHCNTAGAAALGFGGDGADWRRVLERAAAGKLDVLVVVEHDIIRLAPAASGALSRVKTVAVLAQNEGRTAERADILLPAATFAERDGVVVNAGRRAQLVRQAFAPLGQARPEWWIWKELLCRTGAPWLVRDAAGVFAVVARETPAFRGMGYGSLGLGGTVLRGRAR